MNSRTILIQNVKSKREHVRINHVLAGQNGQFGVLVHQTAEDLEKAHQSKKDIAVGTQKQALELFVTLEKRTTITFNQSHVIVIQTSIVILNANGKGGLTGVIVIQIVIKVSN